MSRTCSVCRQSRQLEEFEKKKDRPLGRGYRCKPCLVLRAQSYHAAHGPHRRAYARDLARRKPSDRSKYPRLTAREIMEREPEKERARRTLRSWVQKGRIVKPTACQDCGVKATRPLHGHHSDYSKPLDVEWLCHDCHMLRHRKDLALLPPEAPE